MNRSMVLLGILKVYIIIIVALFPVRADAAGQNEELAGSLYNREDSQWRAEVIDITEPGEPGPALDYAALVHHDPWDFEEGDFEGIRKFGPGIKDRKIKKGKLIFTTGPEAYFFWGNHEDEQGYSYNSGWSEVGEWVSKKEGDERIGQGWRRWDDWQVMIRLRQSLPVSNWKVAYRLPLVNSLGKSGPAELREISVEVKGEGWQTVTFPLGSIGAQDAQSLSISTEEEGNKVEIDWIKAVVLREKIYFRKVVDINEPVESASLCLVSNGYLLYINGRKVSSGDHNGQSAVPELIENVGQYLRPGKNIIALEIEAYESSGRELNIAVHGSRQPIPLGGRHLGFALQGFVELQSGNFFWFNSDKSWQARHDVPEGWPIPESASSGWLAVRSLGNVASTQLSGYGKDGRGLFLDPPYIGPLAVTYPGRRQPIFGYDEPVQLEIRLPHRVDKTVRYRLEFSLEDAFSGKQVIKGRLKKYYEEGQEELYTWKRRLKTPGVYNLRLALLAAGRKLDERIIELVVVGKIEQPELTADEFRKRMELKLVDEVDYSNAEDKHPFYDSGKYNNVSRLVTSPIGQYRETAVTSDINQGAWISSQVKLEHLYVPHIVEIEYPDDRKRTMEILIAEGNIVRSCVGVYTGHPYPLTNEMKKYRFVYFPERTNPTISILSNQPGKRAAVAGIKVYEVVGELPALRTPNDNNNRMLGIHQEDTYLPLTNFAAGPEGLKFRNRLWLSPHQGFYRSWYRTFANLIRYMRYSGQNVYLGAHWIYAHPLYPIRKDSLYSRYNYATQIRKDYLGLLARMFEYNNLNLIIGVEFFTTIPLNIEMSKVSDEDVRQGKETLAQVSKEGIQSAQWGQISPNPLQPRVEEEILRVTDEIAALYKEYPAVKGISFVTINSGWQPVWIIPSYGKDNLEYSYDDYTIRLFEEDTGIKVPVGSSDPVRFGKRYTWLLENVRKEWIAWRNQAIYSVNMKIRDRIVAARPDWQYYLIFSDVDGQGMQKNWKESDLSVKEVLLERAMYPGPYKGEKGLFLVRGYGPNGGRRNESYAQWWRLEYSAGREFNISDEGYSLHDNGMDTGAYIENDFFEPDLIPRPGEWFWEGAVRGCPIPVPSGRFMLDDFAVLLSQATPTLTLFAWLDINYYGGQEEIIREFAQTYFSLPQGEYKTLRGKGRDKNVALRRLDEERASYFYLVNLLPWNTRVDLTLRGNQSLKNLVTNRHISLTSIDADRYSLGLNLKPYQIKVFKMDRDMEIVSAWTSVDREGGLWLQTEINSLRKISSAVGDEKFERKIMEAVRALKEGDIARGRNIVLGYEIRSVADPLRKR